MTLVCVVALGAGSMAYNRSIDAEPFPEPLFPLPMADTADVTPTTWLAPPVTRDPFAPVGGLTVDQVPVAGPAADGSADSSNTGADGQPEGSGGLPATTVDQPTTTLDDRPLGEVVDSRLPSTTTTAQTDLAGP